MQEAESVKLKAESLCVHSPGRHALPRRRLRRRCELYRRCCLRLRCCGIGSTGSPFRFWCTCRIQSHGQNWFTVYKVHRQNGASLDPVLQLPGTASCYLHPAPHLRETLRRASVRVESPSGRRPNRCDLVVSSSKVCRRKSES
jgi:hypothetical protein